MCGRASSTCRGVFKFVREVAAVSPGRIETVPLCINAWIAASAGIGAKKRGASGAKIVRRGIG